jgi:hypothetical protein
MTGLVAQRRKPGHPYFSYDQLSDVACANRNLRPPILP